jgi:CubicO group peptidase (beta-lactamase class C family)
MVVKMIGQLTLITGLACCWWVANADEFEPAYTMDEILEHQRNVPGDEHWWAVTGPQMGWMHKNTQQMFPSVPVYRAGQVRELESRPMAEIADFVVQTPNGEMRFEDMLFDEQSTAMGVVILHKGDIIFESYPRMKDYEKIIYWSVSKVFSGTIVRLLEERGLVDISEPIETYIPELADSSFAGTTVRSFLDHASGLDCDENYEDPQSCYYQYSMAIGENVRDDSAVDNPYDYFINADVARLREQGTKFRYSGANNFILAWLIQEVTGYPFQDIVTREFWQHIGAESDAGFFAYRYGIAVSHGGFQARMRDLARFGLLFTPSSHVVTDKKIISDEFIHVMRTEGNPSLKQDRGDGMASHPMYQWEEVYSHDWLNHGGWGGQGLMISPSRDVVALFTSYTKEDNNEIDLSAVMFDLLNTVFSEISPAAQ